jgi:beta-xylosidase
MVLTALLLMVPSVQAEPLSVRDLSEAEDRFAANPRAVKDIGDPFVLKTEDGYQMFATGGPIGFFTWKSNDLVKFERTKALKKVSWAASDYWAPEVFAWQGKYVMLFTARQRSTGSLRTGIAFSDTPEGEYKDPLDAPLMDYGYATIDATLTTDAEGNPYLIYVRDISENRIGSGGESHIYGVRLADDLLSTVGDPVLLLTPQGEWESRSGSERWNEGPAVLEHDGKWYLFYHDCERSNGVNQKRNVKFRELTFNPDGSIKTMDGMEW